MEHRHNNMIRAYLGWCWPFFRVKLKAKVQKILDNGRYSFRYRRAATCLGNVKDGGPGIVHPWPRVPVVWKKQSSVNTDVEACHNTLTSNLKPKRNETGQTKLRIVEIGGISKHPQIKHMSGLSCQLHTIRVDHTEFFHHIDKKENLEDRKFLHSCEHFNHCATNTPNVSSAAIAIAFNDLWGHPEYRTSDRLESISLRGIVKCLETKQNMTYLQ